MDENAGKKSYHFFVDGNKFEWPNQNITGAQLRALVRIEPNVGIFLEEHGQDRPDKPINDTSSIDLDEKGGVKKFYTVPPATMGRF